MSFFAEAFYPTPDEVIDQMVAPFAEEYNGYWALKAKRCLDPSAGKGNILDRLVNRYHAKSRDLRAIEIDPELQMILNEKGYPVIESDFLQYRDRYRFDLILMNPPFDEGAAHLLKAWEILEGGNIVCLLNAETVRNPYSKDREILAGLIKLHGSVEYIGQVFKNAERPTDVECCIVRMSKAARKTEFDFQPGSVETDAPINEAAFEANPLASVETIKTLVMQYEKAAELLIAVGRLQSEYCFYVRGIARAGLSVDNSDDRRNPAHSLDAQIDELKAQFWAYIFEKTKIGEKTTSNYRRKFADFTSQTERLSFSEANIRRILSLFFLNGDQIMLDCLVEVFDKATEFHKDNKFHPEGWDHNKSWKLAPMIIIPRGISYDQYKIWMHHWDSHRDFYGDLDKVLCYLDGREVGDTLTVNAALQHRIDDLNRSKGMRHDGKFCSHYFEVRIFKKGTVHLRFLDRALLDEFNRKAAQGKQWIGQGF